MMKLTKHLCTYTALLGFLFLLPAAQSNPYVISDDRARGLDITPVLGRGYSIMTNSYHSNCLMIDMVTVPSYNYDYSFYDFVSDLLTPEEISSKFSHSFGYSFLMNQFIDDVEHATGVEGNNDVISSVRSKVKYVASSMRIERYYESVREDQSTLEPMAITLLGRRDYVGFFKACGPNYIRGIRRAQEVNAFFMWTSESVDKSKNWAKTIKTSHSWYTPNLGGAIVEQSTEAVQTRIVIKGFGLGLSQEGSETLVAQSLEEYNKVMTFAFTSMTGNKVLQIGMVYGFEVNPWAHNPEFLLQANIIDDPIEVLMPPSLIPLAFNPDSLDAVYQTSDRLSFRCKNPTFVIDKYGYCCETSALYDIDSLTYDSSVPEEKTCRPLRILPPATVKDNMIQNGEFVTRLDTAMRSRMNQLSMLQNCISGLKAIAERYDYHYLKPNARVNYASNMHHITVLEAKLALDPFGDWSLMKNMMTEQDEWFEMFLQPCYAAIYGINVGTSPGTDISYLSSYPWYEHEECRRLSCLSANSRWDRSTTNGGCTRSLIMGETASSFGSDDGNCKKVLNNGVYECENGSGDLKTQYDNAKAFWSTVLPQGNANPSYFLDYYCLPRLAGENEKMDAKEIVLLKMKRYLGVQNLSLNDLDDIFYKDVNVALDKPTRSSGVYSYHWTGPDYEKHAVDGNKNGSIYGRSVYHSWRTFNSFWEVDLQDDYTLKKITIYNRRDYYGYRLAGARVTLYHADGSKVGNSDGYELNSDYEQTVSFSVPVENVRRVKVHYNNRAEYLQLAEVEVYAKVDISSTLLE